MTTLDTSSLTEMQNAILQRASTLKNAAGLSTSATKDVGGVSSVVDGSKSGGILSFNDALNEAMSSVNDSYIQSTESTGCLSERRNDRYRFGDVEPPKSFRRFSGHFANA